MPAMPGGVPLSLYALLGLILVASTLALVGKVRERQAYRASLREQGED